MGIAHILAQISIGEFLGFDLDVQGFLAVVPPLLDRKLIRDIHLERGIACRFCHFVHGPAVVSGADWIDPFRRNFDKSSACIKPPSARSNFRMAAAVSPW